MPDSRDDLAYDMGLGLRKLVEGCLKHGLTVEMVVGQLEVMQHCLMADYRAALDLKDDKEGEFGEN